MISVKEARRLSERNAFKRSPEIDPKKVSLCVKHVMARIRSQALEGYTYVHDIWGMEHWSDQVRPDSPTRRKVEDILEERGYVVQSSTLGGTCTWVRWDKYWPR